MKWSENDNLFVNGNLEVFSIDLFSEPLKWIQCKVVGCNCAHEDDFKQFLISKNVQVVDYNGPRSDDFKSFLISRNLLVNCQGKAVIHVRRCRCDEVEFDSYVLEKVVPLDPFAFQNKPLLKPQAANGSQSLFEHTSVELAKKNHAYVELQSVLKETKAELEKKNYVIDELLKRKIDQNWNSERFRFTMGEITSSIKRASIGFDLDPPASGDPDSVLRFLEMLRDLILHKYCVEPFFVAANEILASIASMLYQRSGLSIGMETNNSPSSITPSNLTKNLIILRDSLKSRLFVDASIIVRDLRLMNENDLPIIFRDSAADVAKLKEKEVGTKSIDNFGGNRISYGYFNIPRVGMFKGVLTRVVDKKLPDEITKKLRVGEYQKLPHELSDDKRFWFVNANGSGIFEDVNFKLPPFSQDFLGFLRRMNGIYVNAEGSYVKFAFTAARTPNTHYPNGQNSKDKRMLKDHVRYFDKGIELHDMFESALFNAETPEPVMLQEEVSLPLYSGNTVESVSLSSFNWIVNGLDKEVAFTFNGYCFVGKMTAVSGAFRNNGWVTAFFKEIGADKICYVDAQATTAFVLSKTLKKCRNDGKIPGFK